LHTHFSALQCRDTLRGGSGSGERGNGRDAAVTAARRIAFSSK